MKKPETSLSNLPELVQVEILRLAMDWATEQRTILGHKFRPTMGEDRFYESNLQTATNALLSLYDEKKR